MRIISIYEMYYTNDNEYEKFKIPYLTNVLFIVTLCIQTKAVHHRKTTTQ